MSNIPGLLSQDSCEPSMEPDCHIEAAKAIFRKARADVGNETICEFQRLYEHGAPREEQEKCFVPFFKELASLIAGKQDLTPPRSADHFDSFHVLLDQPLLEFKQKRWRGKNKDLEDFAIRQLIDYITNEVDKVRKIEFNQGFDVAPSVEQAWKTDYMGETDKLLREAVSSMYHHSMGKPYANFCPIIQGSGTGKSRLVDKLAESVFTIPITLRPLDDKQGFPLGDTANDEALLDFFCKPDCFTSALHAQLSYLQFLLKTLAIADKWIDDYKESGCGMENIAAEWRKHLGAPRTPHRSDTYSHAIDKSTLKGFENILDETVRYDTLQARVKKFVRVITEKLEATTDGEPRILFYFDEAQHLTKFTVTKEKEERRTAYQCLCKAFTYMLDVPVFALFLSTYSRLSEFSPSARNFWSSRLLSSTTKESNDNLNAPFVELPFDVWKAPTIVTEGTHSADEICSLRFMARFGRPMFWAILESSDATEAQMVNLAMSKLKLHFEDPTRKQYNTGAYDELIPLLAARVDFTFESNRDEAVFIEGHLVASAMRSAYSVPQHRQYLRGGYPSEPFLAEAAARATFVYFQTRAKGTGGDIATIIREYKDVVPLAVSAWFQQGLIDKGPRGELVARMLCTLAHDMSILKKLTTGVLHSEVSFSQMVPVVDFFRALIVKEHVDKILDAQPQNTKGKPLREVFEKAYVHFTQFVKAGDASVMTDKAAYLLFTRGAAIQGYGTMGDVDFIIPVWIRGDGNPDRGSMTAIFIQVKNRKAEQKIHIDVQKKHFFTRGNERPYITIAMQLGLNDRKKYKDELVKVSPPYAKKLRDKAGKYPRYEIFINGCSNEAYNVIGGASDTYSALLADTDILSEHPRKGKFLAAIKRMKPFWASDSYDWATMIKKASGQLVEYEDGHVRLDGGQEGEENRLTHDLSRLRIDS